MLKASILLGLLTFAALTTDASAQARRSSTDSGGGTRYYDRDGRTTGRSTTSGDTTTTYDRDGRVIGRETTTNPRR